MDSNLKIGKKQKLCRLFCFTAFFVVCLLEFYLLCSFSDEGNIDVSWKVKEGCMIEGAPTQSTMIAAAGSSFEFQSFSGRFCADYHPTSGRDFGKDSRFREANARDQTDPVNTVKTI